MCKITITKNGIWAGTGRYNDGVIENCPAILGPDQDASYEIYEALEDALESGEAMVSVNRPDGVYTAELAITVEQMNELLDKAHAANLTSPEQVADMVEEAAGNGGYEAGLAELERCIKAEAEEAKAAGIE